MAEASAAAGRRKASALRSARAASDDAAQDLRLSALCLPLFFWRRTIRAVRCQNSDADASRECDRFPRPLRERTDRAQRDQVRAWESRRFRRPSPGAPLRGTPPSPARGEGAASVAGTVRRNKQCQQHAAKNRMIVRTLRNDWRRNRKARNAKPPLRRSARCSVR